MIDHFNKFEQYLDFSDPGTFYFIEIISRKKDNPDRKHAKILNRYFIDSLDRYNSKKDSIKAFCRAFNARAYMRVNRRNFTDVAQRTLRLIAEYFEYGNYKAVKKAYHSACGQVHSEQHRKWVIDFDNQPFRHVDEVITKVINPLHDEITDRPYKVITTAKTPNGWHVISHPFNKIRFKKRYKKTWGDNVPEIKTDAPTILFYERIPSN